MHAGSTSSAHTGLQLNATKCKRKLSSASPCSSCNFLVLWNSYDVLYTIYCKSLMACLMLCWFYLDLLHCRPAWWGSSHDFTVFNQSPNTCSLQWVFILRVPAWCSASHKLTCNGVSTALLPPSTVTKIQHCIGTEREPTHPSASSYYSSALIPYITSMELVFLRLPPKLKSGEQNH